MNVINWSGGHDSTVMLHYLLHNRKDLEPFKVVFVDSTIIVPETFEYLKEISKLFGIENQFVMLYPKRTFYEYLANYQFWPSIRALWCRKELKLDPLKVFYNSFTYEAVREFIGISRKDSAGRNKLYSKPVEYRKWGKKIVLCEYPILDWSDEKKKAYMIDHNIPENPSYRILGVSGCYCCPYLHPPHYRTLLQIHPELFHTLLYYESAMQRRAHPDFWLADIYDDERYQTVLTKWMEEIQAAKI